MINSVFIINPQGKVIVEKHWRGIISRQIVDVFNNERDKFRNSLPRTMDRSSIGRNEDPYFEQSDVPPILESEKYWLLNVQRHNLFWLCPVDREVDPMLVFEFIHRIIDTLEDYLGDGNISESSIRDNFVTVYQLLEEMMDYGYPHTTEPNALKEIIQPPTLMNKVMATVNTATGAAPKIPQNMSNIPWRKAGVKYTQNEIYFDIVEEIDATIDAQGKVISCEVRGSISARSQLSGMPDLSLSFTNPRVIDDASFHPCVRYRKWEAEKVLSFVPPDGKFNLMSYRVVLPTQGIANVMPLQVRPQIIPTKNGGKFDITVLPRTHDGKDIANLSLQLALPSPKDVTGANATCNSGKYMYDSASKSIKWDVDRVQARDKAPMLSGTFSSKQEKPAGDMTVTVNFNIDMYTISGLKVGGLRLFHEQYKPYKGVRSRTKAGKFHVRT